MIYMYIGGNTSKPRTMTFDENEFFDTILYKVSIACTKMAKIEVSDTQFLFFVFPEHCAFCFCEVLTRCHRYVLL